jgi:hypothetical protein
MNPTLYCWQCGHKLEDLPLPISRHANCQQCYEVLHCCRFCIHYDKTAHDDCQEDKSEPPHNKESANFCEYFKPNASAFQAAPTNHNATSNLKSLFGDLKEDDPKTIQKSENYNNPLDHLFDDLPND